MSFARVDPANPSHPPAASGLPPIPEAVNEYKYVTEDPTSYYETVAAPTVARYDPNSASTLYLLWQLLSNQLHNYNDTLHHLSNTPLVQAVSHRFGNTHLSRLKMPPIMLNLISPHISTGIYRILHASTGSDLFMTVAIVVVMLIQLRDRRHWHQMDMFVKLLLGVACFCIPHISLHYQVHKPQVDAIEIHVTRMVGALMLGFAVLDYRLRYAVLRDSRVAYDIAVARFMAMLLALVAVVYVHTAPDTVWNHRHALWSGALLAVHAVGDFVQVITSQHTGQIATRRTFLNVHLGIDHVLTFLIGIMWFAFPIWTLQLGTAKSNYVAISSHVGHFIGALYLYWSLLAVRTAYWPSAELKRDFVVSRLTTEGLIILSNILLLVTTETWGRHLVGHLPWQIGAHSLLALNLMLANFAQDVPIYTTIFQNFARPRDAIKTSTRTYYNTRGSGAAAPLSSTAKKPLLTTTGKTTIEPSLTGTSTSTRTTTTTSSSAAADRNLPVESWLSSSRSPSPTRRRLQATTTRRTAMGSRGSTLDK